MGPCRCLNFCPFITCQWNYLILESRYITSHRISLAWNDEHTKYALEIWDSVCTRIYGITSYWDQGITSHQISLAWNDEHTHFFHLGIFYKAPVFFVDVGTRCIVSTQESRVKHYILFLKSGSPNAMCPGRKIEPGSPDPKARIIPLDRKSGLEILGWILTLIDLHYFHFRWLHPKFLSGYYTPDFRPLHYLPFLESQHFWWCTSHRISLCKDDEHWYFFHLGIFIGPPFYNLLICTFLPWLHSAVSVCTVKSDTLNLVDISMSNCTSSWQLLRVITLKANIALNQ